MNGIQGVSSSEWLPITQSGFELKIAFSEGINVSCYNDTLSRITYIGVHVPRGNDNLINKKVRNKIIFLLGKYLNK